MNSNQYPTAGENLGLSTLWLAGNFNSNPFGDLITVEIAFSSAVTDVSFSVYDLADLQRQR